MRRALRSAVLGFSIIAPLVSLSLDWGYAPIVRDASFNKDKVPITNTSFEEVLSQNIRHYGDSFYTRGMTVFLYPSYLLGAYVHNKLIE